MKPVGRIPFMFLTLMLLVLNVSESSGQTGVILYPSNGSVSTDILLEAYVPINSRNNIFWDDTAIALDARRGQENYALVMHIKAPNQHPYSDLGNHTVTVESFYWDGSDKVMYMNATFEITEYLPCDEWLALNATYYALLDDYNALNASYYALQAQHNDLTNTYQELLGDYNTKLANYSSLSTSYESLCDNYDTLETNYNSLQSNNDELTTSYNALTGELATARNLSYVFTATTMILIATTVYFAVRKPKMKTP
jgi:hypothetical protein